MSARLTRIVTCYRQWPQISHWLQFDALFDPGVEWILINDCPGDPCPPGLAAKIRGRSFHLVEVERNLGRSAARNLGAQRATAEWIEHIDGDDLPLPVSVAELPLALDADVLQFPAPEVCRPASEIGDGSEFTQHTVHGENWSPLLRDLSPFDVRLTATMWNRGFFLQLGGYDGRFEGIEDVHLAFKAAQRKARSRSMGQPKQVYCRRPGRPTLGRMRIEGARRFYRWLQINHPDVESKLVRGWIAKEEAYLLGHIAWGLVRHPGRVFDYMQWRLSS